MQTNPSNYLASFAEHLTTQYGERGTPAREEFKECFEVLEREAIRQEPPTRKQQCELPSNGCAEN